MNFTPQDIINENLKRRRALSLHQEKSKMPIGPIGPIGPI